MKSLFLLLPLLALSAMAEPKARATENPPLPKTEKELKTWLDRTKWISQDGNKLLLTFNGLHFETPVSKGTFSVDKPRLIVMKWEKGAKIRCLLDEQGGKLTEIDGRKNVFLFDSRVPEEEAKPSKLPPKKEE